MARGKLWSVKGVSTEAREAAREAARESGQPIGVWIDQAILMNGEDETSTADVENTPTATDANAQVDIITILEALEQRVAHHADRIAEQLAPVRDSINEIGTRLERLEEKRAGSVAIPASPPSPDQPVDAPSAEFAAHQPDPEPDFRSEPPSEPEADETAQNTSDVTSGTAYTQPGNTPPEAGRITEADIHAADAALKSELTGLFDDGSHHHPTDRHGMPGDPFMSARPPRRTSRAPLVFLLAILIAACAGIAAVAWFEFLSPEMRQSLTSEFVSQTESTQASDTTAAPPTPSIPTTPPAIQVPPEPAPAGDPIPAAPSDTSTPPSAAASQPGASDAPVISPETTPDTTTTSEQSEPVNPELDALREAAATGVATAQNELGVRFLVGRGVAQDYGEAVYWLRKAAAQDMTNAQYNLGVLYDSGRGVEADPTEALIWFHSAAENGHGRSQMAMAAAYASGRGIARNSDEALKWLRQAAESNVPEAQFSLGNVLSTPPASRESLSDAYYWYRIADANGVANASARADQIEAELTPEERAGANARVSHFISQKIPRAPRPSLPRADAPAPPQLRAASEPAPGTTQAASAQTGTPAEPLSRDQVSAIQTLLKQLGFDAGAADGAVGEQTRTAIGNYQRELGLPVNGEPSASLLTHLRQLAGDR